MVAMRGTQLLTNSILMPCVYISIAMPTNFKKLNLNIPFLQAGWDTTKIRSTRRFSLTSMLSTELLHLISELGLKIDHIYVLYYSGAGTSAIHIDNYRVTDQTNLNFVVDTGSARTNWYEIVGENSDQPNKKITEDGIGLYDINQLRLIESIDTAGVGLFQSGVPHNVTAVDSPRWCVSIKLVTPNGQIIKFNDAVRIFDQFIVI